MNRFKNFDNFRLYEFEENDKNPSAEKVSFMDSLYKKMKNEIIPKIPTEFKIDYNRGKDISVHTDNKKDLKVGVKMENDKIVIYANPISEPQFEVNFNFESANADNIIYTLLSEFERSETKGLYDKSYVETERDMPGFQGEENEDEEDLETPITTKPTRIKRSIEIKIIRSVLEDAYILDDIELKEVTIDELIRRMLLESRKK